MLSEGLKGYQLPEAKYDKEGLLNLFKEQNCLDPNCDLTTLYKIYSFAEFKAQQDETERGGAGGIFYFSREKGREMALLTDRYSEEKGVMEYRSDHGMLTKNKYSITQQLGRSQQDDPVPNGQPTPIVTPKELLSKLMNEPSVSVDPLVKECGSASDALMRIRDASFGDIYNASPLPEVQEVQESDTVEPGFRWRTPTPG